MVVKQAGTPRLLDLVRDAIRLRHYSRRTEDAYVYWVRRFVLFQGKRHPASMGAAEISQFLTWLAVDQQVSASTQNQALSALIFLYREVLRQEIGDLPTVARARTPERLPVVLSRGEVAQVLGELRGPIRLIGVLLYGAGTARVLLLERFRLVRSTAVMVLLRVEVSDGGAVLDGPAGARV